MSQPTKHSQTYNTIAQVPLAGVSNACAAAVTNPVDVVKVNMQMQGEGVCSSTGAHGRGILATAIRIVGDSGPRGLCRGLMPSLLREMSYSGIRFGLYEPTKILLGATDPAHTTLPLKVLAGAITGATGSAIANPCDLVKVRMQADAGGRAQYSSTIDAFARIYREGNGVAGLWRGAGPTVQRATLLTAAQVPSYDHMKHTILNHGYMSEGMLCHFVCSMWAGFIAVSVTAPFDLVKSRVMVQPVDPSTGRGVLYAGTVDCFQSVVRQEGFFALYKGFHTQWLRLGPHTTISLMVFEHLRYLAGMNYL